MVSLAPGESLHGVVMAMSLVLTTILGVWLGIMTGYPVKWGAFVDRWYDFWQRFALIKPLPIGWMRRFEKGPGFKLLLRVGFAFSLITTLKLLAEV